MSMSTNSLYEHQKLLSNFYLDEERISSQSYHTPSLNQCNRIRNSKLHHSTNRITPFVYARYLRTPMWKNIIVHKRRLFGSKEWSSQTYWTGLWQIHQHRGCGSGCWADVNLNWTLGNLLQGPEWCVKVAWYSNAYGYPETGGGGELISWKGKKLETFVLGT